MKVGDQRYKQLLTRFNELEYRRGLTLVEWHEYQQISAALAAAEMARDAEKRKEVQG